jgi:hypothetical protein
MVRLPMLPTRLSPPLCRWPSAFEKWHDLV